MDHFQSLGENAKFLVDAVQILQKGEKTPVSLTWTGCLTLEPLLWLGLWGFFGSLSLEPPFINFQARRREPGGSPSSLIRSTSFASVTGTDVSRRIKARGSLPRLQEPPLERIISSLRRLSTDAMILVLIRMLTGSDSSPFTCLGASAIISRFGLCTRLACRLASVPSDFVRLYLGFNQSSGLYQILYFSVNWGSVVN